MRLPRSLWLCRWYVESIQFCDLCGKLRLGDRAKYFPPPRECPHCIALRQHLKVEITRKIKIFILKCSHYSMNVLIFHFLAIIIQGTSFGTRDFLHQKSPLVMILTFPSNLELATDSNLGTSQRQLLQLVPLTASLSNIS
jgi:hypothetical protein